MFFARMDKLGRRLPDVLDDNDKPIVGPWRWNNKEYKRMDYQGVNLQVIAQHLSGALTDDWGERVQAQTYAVNFNGTSVWTTIDLDVKGEAHADVPEHFNSQELALDAARKLIAEIEALRLKAHLEITKSAGYRVWIFHERCPWTYAKDLGRLLLTRASLHVKIEVFPSTAPSGRDGFGTAVLLPCWGGNKARGRQVMIDSETQAARDVMEFVSDAIKYRTTTERLTEIITAATQIGEIKETPARRERSERTGDEDNSFADEKIAAHCWQAQLNGCEALREVARRCEAGSELSRAEWMRLATHLKQYADWGLAEFHRLSSFDSRYMEYETDMMFESLQYGPTRCDKMECGRDPQVDCEMADGKVSASWFAYQYLKLLPMSSPAAKRAKQLRQSAPSDSTQKSITEESDGGQWSPEQCLPDPESFWRIGSGAIWLHKENKKGETETVRVIGQVVQIVARARDVDDGSEHITLRWIEKNAWKEATVTRRMISDTHAILALADFGLGVNSINARDLVAYLAHLLDFHQGAISVEAVVSCCGHKTIDKKNVFVMGGTVLGAEEVQVTIAPAADPNGYLRSLGPDTNRDELESLKRWTALADRLGNYSIAAFAIGAGLLPCLLADLRLVQNPVIDFGGRSSSGKSTLLRLIASMWGLAPEMMGGQVRSWSSTPVFVEKIAALCNDLPIFLDESHNAKPETVQSIVYQYANGTGKGRGTREGSVQRVARYRGVLFSAGEVKLADLSAHDGVQGRVLGFWGSPFGTGQADLVAEINDVAATCYGVVGPGMCSRYLQHRAILAPQVQSWQEAAYQRLRRQVCDGLGERLAAVEAACHLVSKNMGLSWDVTKIVEEAFALLTDGRKSDSAQSSLELVGAWAAGRIKSFVEETPHPVLDPNEVLGRYVRDPDGSRRLAMLPEAVKRVLEQHKYPYAATVAHWKDRGWLETDSEKGQSRSTKKMRLQGRSVGLLSLSPEGMRIAMGLDLGDDLGLETGESSFGTQAAYR